MIALEGLGWLLEMANPEFKEGPAGAVERRAAIFAAAAAMRP